eukprot:1160940-Pelagomonas_calceolata.AAC.4
MDGLQAAAFYTDASLREFGSGGVAQAVVHHGKEMSYNNYLVPYNNSVVCYYGAFHWCEGEQQGSLCSTLFMQNSVVEKGRGEQGGRGLWSNQVCDLFYPALSSQGLCCDPIEARMWVALGLAAVAIGQWSRHLNRQQSTDAATSAVVLLKPVTN